MRVLLKVDISLLIKVPSEKCRTIWSMFSGSEFFLGEWGNIETAYVENSQISLFKIVYKDRKAIATLKVFFREEVIYYFL